MDDATRARRATLPGKLTHLEDDHGDDLRAYTTATQRLEMMWPLAVDAWLMSGRPWPRYSRAEMPGVVRRAGGADRG